ncbi:hypothetical protein D3C87_1839830 [compost metagenome]
MGQGRRTPPPMAMTMRDEAFLVLAPRPVVPRAKMVANMVDMKKKTAIRAMGDTLSMPAATIRVRTTLITP